MSKQRLPLTDAQWSELVQAVRLRRNSWATYAPYLDMVHRVLRHADLLPADDADGAATIGSVVHIRRPDSIRAESVVLVLPRDEDPTQRRLSVLSPLGWELLGARAGDKVHAATPTGIDTFIVERTTRPAPRAALAAPAV